MAPRAGLSYCHGALVRLALYQGDRVLGMELFEPGGLDVARARFEELRPHPLR